MLRDYAYVTDLVDDPGGCIALDNGIECYDAGMHCSDAADHDERIAYFRDAEGWYLQAAHRGNPFGWLNLGYMYSYDRCEGSYYVNAESAMIKRVSAIPDDYRQWLAFNCYTAAAEMGLAEGCYKLGDMFKRGMGREADAAKAFGWYARAVELGDGDEPVIWGSAALRLATCYENGNGCEQDIEKARGLYGTAVEGLEIAVNSGNWYYKKVLANARDGLRRTQQGRDSHA